MFGQNKTASTQRAILFLVFTIAILTPWQATAGVVNCDAEVLSVLTYARGPSEGNVIVKAKLDASAGGGVYAWTLCNLNEDKLVGGVATSKNGVELIAAQESYAATCRAILNSIHIGKSTERKMRFAFLDNIFPTCADVPSWGGIVGVDTDDPDGRLGAWDGLYYVELLDKDSDAP